MFYENSSITTFQEAILEPTHSDSPHVEGLPTQNPEDSVITIEEFK